MKRISIALGVIIALLLLVGISIYFFFPGTLVTLTNYTNASGAQLEDKELDLNGYTVHYFISEEIDPQKETLVLLHGMGDDKNSFVQSAKFLAPNYNLILPDLAGHGQNAKAEDKDYSIRGQVEFVHSFLEKLDVKKFHLAGNSMGGHTAAAYAIAYPEQVQDLVLVNAAGIRIPDHVVYGGFGAPIKNKEELNQLLGRVFYKIPDIPGPVANHMIGQINSSMDFVNVNLVSAITNGKDFDLTDRTQYIQAPTLILWGKHDQVVTFDVAEYYNKTIPLSEIEILENGAHSPQLEIPEEVANSIHTFIQKPKTNMISSTKDDHAAKVQYYRWYQLYEGELSPQRIENQMSILSDDIVIKSAAGEMKGKENYPSRLSAYKGWKNAHHVQNVSVEENENGILHLEADIIYQNVKPDGEQSKYSIHYDTHLQKQDGELLPKFIKLNIQPTGNLEITPFESAYAKNRTLSLMHYWLLNMEQLDGNVAPFKEILAENFTLDFSTSTPITSLAQLEKWLQGTPSQLKVSSHTPVNFKVETLEKDKYQVNVDFVWRGVTKDDKMLKATTSHTWLVIDNPKERFAKIKEAKVVQKEPLSPL